jgi:Predicted membrane protein (DUF2154).
MKRNRNWFWGLFFIVGALILFSSAIGWSFGLSLWQWFVVIFMSSIILKSIPRLEFFGIIMPLPFIYLAISQYLPEAYQRLNIFTLIVVAVFLSIGLSILFRKKRHYNFWSCDGISGSSRRRSWDDDDDDWDDEIDITFEKKQKTSEDDVSASVTFGDGTKYVYSKNLDRGHFDCTFGQLKVYFDEAVLAESGAEIVVNCNFGVIELYFPREWWIINDLTSTLGAVTDYSHHTKEVRPKVHLRGSATFSEIKIFRI